MSNVPGRIIAGVDDDFRVRESMTSLLESAGFEPRMFRSAEEFLTSDTLAEADCLITDVRMSGMNGLELQRRVRGRRPPLPVIFITAHNQEEIQREALAGGAMQFMYKPFDGADLLRFIEAALAEQS